MVVTYDKVHLECILSRINEPRVHLVGILLELSLFLDMLRLPHWMLPARRHVRILVGH
jgi:hypothetical protein